MVLTKEEMIRAGIPPHLRDNCAHLLIPLNKCRRETWYAPWKCTAPRAEYAKCLHYDYMRRVQVARKRRDEKLGVSFPVEGKPPKEMPSSASSEDSS